MKGHFYKPNCKCTKGKRCTCGATWSYIIDIGINPQTGKRKQKKKGGFKTKQEAQNAAAQLITELNSGIYVEEKNITFEQYADEWIENYQNSGKVKISTVRVRLNEKEKFLQFFGKYKMKDVTKRMYQQALNDLKKQGYADNTLDGIHSTGRMIFKQAVADDVIKVDPTTFASIPRSQKTVEEIEKEKEIPKYLEKEELALFLNTAKTQGLDRDYPIFLTLAYTGIRIGELAALKWKDIDFKEQTISISKTLYNPTSNVKNYTLLTPKTKTSKRIIDVDKIVLNELLKLKNMQNEIKMKYRKIYHDQDFVFAQLNNNPGYPVYLKLIRVRIHRLLKLAGLNENLTPHSLRHTHTSLLAEADVNLEVIMQRLGHSDDEVTKNIYLHVTKPKKKEASQKFSELMSNL